MIRLIRRVRVFPTPGDRRRGRLVAGNLVLPCALGRAGVKTSKREGDGATPRASLPIRGVLYRADRMPRPATALPARPIRVRDGWCDAVGDRNYNRPIALPYRASHERMRRDDHLYDVVVELGWNDRPRVQGRGSAIFLHLARPAFGPTEGCVAVAPAAVRRLLAALHPEAVLTVG